VAITFAWVPPGIFLLGSPEDEPDRGSDERRHRVTLTRGSWLGIHPVTRGQWWAVLGGRRPGEPDRPAEKVTWHQCLEFCERLGEKTGRRFRLATEAEWERACRAGTTTPYFFGATIPADRANFGGPALGRRGTTPVGSYPPNAFGLYDMHGNVWDWCADLHGPYSRARNVIDPPGRSTGTTRILRGGSWHYHLWNCRSAFRGRNGPETVQAGGGCRVCLDEG
jgi:formylglycine-generating enzyme required for sulfatase activity